MSKKTRLFVLSWDQLGIEGVVDVTEMEERRIDAEKQQMWDVLRDKPADSFKGRNNDISSIVHMMTLRAKFNNHRHYEIYSVNTEYSITAKDIRQMFESDPQGSADLIRLRGKQLYSDRDTGRGVVIR